MSKLLPANRVAAISAFLTGLAAAVLAITNTFPHNWQQSAVAIGGILGAIGTSLHFMLGSQKMDQNLSNEKVASLNLQAAQLYHAASQQPDSHTFDIPDNSNVTDVTVATDNQEVLDVVNEEELAVPEDLNSEQWLANRDPGTQDQVTTASTDTATTTADQSEGIEEPTSTATPDVS